jgi:SAM-dependent methyltransferase
MRGAFRTLIKESNSALSFGSAARLYDAIRPGCPMRAVDWALGADPVRVLDLGAATGLLTGVLRAAGHEVVTVELNQQMRAVAAERHPDLQLLAGSAEEIPLPDAFRRCRRSGAGVSLVQPAEGLAADHRLLRERGVFAPIWNVRDERTPWVAALSGIVGSEGYGLESTSRSC